jgi:hypothetical protein
MVFAYTHVTEQRQKITETLPFALFHRGAAIQSGALRGEQFAVQIGFTILTWYFGFGFRQGGMGAAIHALVKSLHLLIQSKFERQTVPSSSFHLVHNTSMAYERSDPVYYKGWCYGRRLLTPLTKTADIFPAFCFLTFSSLTRLLIVNSGVRLKPGAIKTVAYEAKQLLDDNKY